YRSNTAGIDRWECAMPARTSARRGESVARFEKSKGLAADIGNVPRPTKDTERGLRDGVRSIDRSTALVGPSIDNGFDKPERPDLRPRHAIGPHVPNNFRGNTLIALTKFTPTQPKRCKPLCAQFRQQVESPQIPRARAQL